MANMIKMSGMSQVVAKLKKATNLTKDNLSRGLVYGGQYLQAESMRIAPVQTGNMRASAFTRKITKYHVIVGYTAPYAAFVHEIETAAHGKAFNVKHADKIAKANENLYFNEKGKVIGQKAGTRRHPIWFNRGEKQQWKFLEKPAREKRVEILTIVAAESRKI
jgi:hypothetical protein